MKKGQFALEFVILVSFTIMFTAIFLVMVQGNNLQSQKYRQANQVAEVMRIISTEVDLARASPSGYTRTFYIPQVIDGVPYNLNSSIDGIDIVFDYYGKTYVYFLPNVSLKAPVTLGTGYNKISNDCSSPATGCVVYLKKVEMS